MKNTHLFIIATLVCQLMFSQKTTTNHQHKEWTESTPCAALEIKPENRKETQKSSTKGPTIENGLYIIDLVIFYSHKNVERLGETAARDRLLKGYRLTNEALENSNTNFRFRMVGLEKLQTPDSWKSLDDAVGKIRHYEPAQSRRAELRADAVYYEGTETGCGLAWVRSDIGNMVATGSLNCGTNVMRHELGHNMGLGHGTSNENHTGHYGLGWSPERTVMAGNSIPYFSSPKLVNPANGNPLGFEGKVDGVRAMNEFSATVSAYFDSNVVGNEVESDIINEACSGSAIQPFIQTNDTWDSTSIVTVNEDDSVRFGPQPVSVGSWKWEGPNGFTSTQREALISESIKENQAGTYISTYTNGCGAVSKHTFTVFVKTADTIDEEPYIYPNPAENSIFVAANKDDLISIKITTIGGIVVIKKTTDLNSEINVSKLIKGVYIAQIESKKKTYYRKFVKK